LIANAIMALKNWKVTGSIGGAQMLTLPRHFTVCIFVEIVRGFPATGFRTVRVSDSMGCDRFGRGLRCQPGLCPEFLQCQSGIRLRHQTGCNGKISEVCRNAQL
jgi:hypothetical protein